MSNEQDARWTIEQTGDERILCRWYTPVGCNRMKREVAVMCDWNTKEDCRADEALLLKVLNDLENATTVSPAAIVGEGKGEMDAARKSKAYLDDPETWNGISDSVSVETSKPADLLKREDIENALIMHFGICDNSERRTYLHGMLESYRAAHISEVERVTKERDELDRKLKVCHQYLDELGAPNTVDNAGVYKAAIPERIRLLHEAAESKLSQLQLALERTLRNFERVLEGKPVRDADETIAEAKAAILNGGQS